MRRISLNTGQVKDQSVARLLDEVARASADENLVDIAAAFTIEDTYTERRTLNVASSSLAEVKEFIATLIDDLKRGGSNRST